MSKTKLGILLILFGILYGMQAWDWFYERTLKRLLDAGAVEQPGKPEPESMENRLGRKSVIIFYSIVFIAVGILLIVADFYGK